jgi:eukaryotic-like serine/threonine-protein kinase
LSMLQFSSTGRQLAGGGFSAGYVWQLDSETPPVLLRGHHGLLSKAAFTRNETRLLTTARDGTIKLWELPSGREILSIPSQGDRYVQLSLSPDNSRLVTVSLQNAIAVRQWLTTSKQSRLKLPPP